MKAEFFLYEGTRVGIRHEPENDAERLLLKLYEIAPQRASATRDANMEGQLADSLEHYDGALAELDELREDRDEWRAASQQAEAEATRLRQEMEQLQEACDAVDKSRCERIVELERELASGRGDAEKAKAIDDAWGAVNQAMARHGCTSLADAITHLDEVRCGTIRRLEQELQELRGAKVQPDEHHVGVTPEGRERQRLAAIPSPAAMDEMWFRHSQGASVADLATEKWESGIGRLRVFNPQIIASVIRAPEPTAPVADEPSTSDDKEAARL